MVVQTEPPPNTHTVNILKAIYFKLTFELDSVILEILVRKIEEYKHGFREEANIVHINPAESPVEVISEGSAE